MQTKDRLSEMRIVINIFKRWNVAGGEGDPCFSDFVGFSRISEVFWAQSGGWETAQSGATGGFSYGVENINYTCRVLNKGRKAGSL